MIVTEKLKQLIESENYGNYKLAIELVKPLDDKYKYQVLYMLIRKHPGLCYQCTAHNNVPELQKIIQEYVESVNLKDLPRKFNKWAYAYFDQDDIPWCEKYVKGTPADNIIKVKKGCGCDG
jgi:hypothetical protein